jgi:hypothetical protein
MQSAEAAYAGFGVPLVLKVSIPKSAAAAYQALWSRVSPYFREACTGQAFLPLSSFPVDRNRLTAIGLPSRF